MGKKLTTTEPLSFSVKYKASSKTKTVKLSAAKKHC